MREYNLNRGNQLLTAQDIMVPNPITINYRASVYEGIKLMEKHNIASLIVVDDTGRVLGILTAKDIVLRVIAKGLDMHTTRVGDIVSRPVSVVEPTAPLKSVVNLMIGTGHGHIPVIDENGKPIGIVTVDDVLKMVPELLEYAELAKR